MSYKGSRQLTIFFTCASEHAAEGDALFANHAAWMEQSHHRDGNLALLMYNVVRGEERENPLDPTSAQTGDVTFVLTEVYSTSVGVADHWRQASQSWEGFEAFASFAVKCKIKTLHASEIVQSLW